jgi:hypothetical protein
VVSLARATESRGKRDMTRIIPKRFSKGALRPLRILCVVIATPDAVVGKPFGLEQFGLALSAERQSRFSLRLDEIAASSRFRGSPRNDCKLDFSQVSVFSW